MTHHSEPEAFNERGNMADKAEKTFQELARTAEALAATADLSAGVHDRMAADRSDIAEHAERERRFAAAERAAAAAFRSGQVPTDDVREIIRTNGGDKPLVFAGEESVEQPESPAQSG